MDGTRSCNPLTGLQTFNITQAPQSGGLACPIPDNSTDSTLCPTSGACGPANLVPTASAPAAGVLCANGSTMSGFSGNGPWSWNCDGTNGISVACGAPFSGVTGSCGSANGSSHVVAPTLNLCNAGGPTPAPSGSGPWNWACVGTGGHDATCSASVNLSGNDCDYTYSCIINGSPTAILDGSLTLGQSLPFSTKCTINPIGADLVITPVYAAFQKLTCGRSSLTCAWNLTVGLTPVPDTSPICDGTFPYTCDVSKSGRIYKCADSGCGIHSGGMCSDGVKSTCQCH